MDNERIAKQLNKAINRYLEKVSLAKGNVRYWPQEFVTSEMVSDEELYQDFQIIFGAPINITEPIEEVTNGTRRKKRPVGPVSE